MFSEAGKKFVNSSPIQGASDPINLFPSLLKKIITPETITTVLGYNWPNYFSQYFQFAKISAFEVNEGQIKQYRKLTGDNETTIEALDIVTPKGLKFIKETQPDLLFLSNILDYSTERELLNFTTNLLDFNIPYLFFTQLAPFSRRSTLRNETFAWPTLQEGGYKLKKVKQRGDPSEALLFSLEG